MENELYTIKNYGQIEIHLKEYMDAKNFTRNALARAINTRFEVIDKWYNGHLKKIDSDILARICFVFDCTPGDLIRYSSTDK